MLPPLSKSTTAFDVVFDGVNFVTALLAYSSVKSGCKVAFRGIENSGSSFFQPEISNFYPQSLVEFPLAKKNYSFFESCAMLFPHYLVPQRLLSINTTKSINSKLHLQADLFLQLDREFASLPITVAKYPVFEVLKSHFSEAILHFELRFDRQRAVMDLLQKCKTEGAVFLANDEPVEAEITLKSSSQVAGVYACVVPDYKLVAGNNVRIRTEAFALDIQSVLSSSCLALHFEKHSSSFQPMADDFQSLVHRLNLPDTDALVNWFQQAYTHFEQSKSQEIIADESLVNLRSKYLQLEKMLSKRVGKKLSFASVVKLLPQRKMSFLNFQQMQSGCDEKFDEAKQTGIAYPLFVQLFYRYPAHIEQMIEFAYEWTGSQLAPEAVWKKAEQQIVNEELKLLLE
jgi:hypothetical protein